MDIEELKRLVDDACMDDFPACRHEAKARLDAISIRLAQRVIATEDLFESAARVVMKFGNDWTEWRDLEDALANYTKSLE